MKITQLIIEAYGCTGPLDDGPRLCEALRAGADGVKATIVKEAVHAYAPHGITAIIFLAESHLMVTTWPEHGYAVAEIFLCNDAMDPLDAWRPIELALRPSQSRHHHAPLCVGRSPE